MRWKKVDGGDDVIDARGSSPTASGPGMGGIPIPIGKAGGGLGLIIAIIVIGMQLLGSGSGSGFDVSQAFPSSTAVSDSRAEGIPEDQDPEKDFKDFSSYVFVTAQQGWQQAFAQSGKQYDKAKLYIYRNGVNTGGCGSASSAVGPFYCPGDQRVYIDLSFYKLMQQQLGASGDVAWGYVIAHELGHHVQQQLGTEAQVRKLQQQNPSEANELSVRMELQADCYAGIWAHRVFQQGDLEDGDIDEAIGAAQAVGDDTLQRNSGQGVHPESFTHGTSAQRAKWFKTGYESGEPAQCDTFQTDNV
ncbi:MAG: neutral zinc metallopeptidase [Solirubrobacterales bacterium]